MHDALVVCETLSVGSYSGGAWPHLAVVAVELQVARAELHDEGRDQQRQPRDTCRFTDVQWSITASQKLQYITGSQPQHANSMQGMTRPLNAPISSM